MAASERRKFQRLRTKFDISCIEIDSTKGQFHTGSTINVSPGGLYFETAAGPFRQGSLLKIHLSIPPTCGLLEFGGKISGFARVLRTEPASDSARSEPAVPGRHGIAVEFCRAPRLCV